jgi:phenylacetic acid degradation operon negative regulatory protein
MLGRLSLDHLHAQPPLRVWSVIVTVFGDLVLDEGREATPSPLATASLLTLMETMGIDAAQTRTALSRLVASGTLNRERAGRASFHTLTPSAMLAFREASELIYGRRLPQPDGSFHLVLTDKTADRAFARQILTEQGFRMLGATSALKTGRSRAESLKIPDGAMHGAYAPDPAAIALIANLYEIPALGAAYASFNAAFARLATAAPADDTDAFVARLCLVHQFRRLVLKDPFLPADCLPTPWPGAEARRIFDALLAKLRLASRRHFGAVVAQNNI